MIFWGLKTKAFGLTKKGGGDPLLLVAYFSVIEKNKMVAGKKESLQSRTRKVCCVLNLFW